MSGGERRGLCVCSDTQGRRPTVGTTRGRKSSWKVALETSQQANIGFNRIIGFNIAF